MNAKSITPTPGLSNNALSIGVNPTPVPTISNALQELGGNLDELRVAINALDTRSATLRSVQLTRAGTVELDEQATNHVYSLIQQHNRTLVALISRLSSITHELDA